MHTDITFDWPPEVLTSSLSANRFRSFDETRSMTYTEEGDVWGGGVDGQ